MEKRVIVAFVLSILVLLAWSFLFAPKPPKAPQKAPQKEEVAQVEKKEAHPETSKPPTAKPAPPPKEELEISPVMKEEEVHIETPLYRAVISSAGPAIKSFKLKKYYKTLDPKSPLVELAHLGKTGGDLLEIDFDHGSNPQTNNTFYQVDGSRFPRCYRP